MATPMPLGSSKWRALDLGLAGKVAWVTGASRGLGREIASEIARCGAAVALTARSEADLRDLKMQIEGGGGSALVAPGSVGSLNDVRAACSALMAAFGRIDILINNAGISPTLKRTETLLEEDWAGVIDVNLTGAFHCSMEAGRHMLEARAGSIVNLSSVHAGVGAARLAAYAASKGGLDALTRSLAVEWADRGVRVNAVAAGYFETAMTAGMRGSDQWRRELLGKIPLGRFGRPAEIVPAVLYLASDLSAYVTGTSLVVDGGWSAQ